MAARDLGYDPTFDYERVYRAGQAGRVGDMPYEPMLEKLERSLVYELPDQVNLDRRSLLIDRTPDEPLFEEDMPREMQYGKQALNIRSGFTRGEPGLMPYLPDGTFLDAEFMEKEDRKQGDLPDMEKFRDHSMVRAGGHRFGSDEPLATNEQEVSGMKLIRERAQSMKDARGRIKVFSVSKDGMAGGRMVEKTEDSRARYYTHDGTLVDSNTSSIYKDATGLIDARTHVGWLTEQDSDFKVAKYGQISRLAKTQDFVAQRHVTADSRKAPELMDQTTKMNLIIDLAGLIKAKHSSVDLIQRGQSLGLSEEQRAAKLSQKFAAGGFDKRAEESRAYEIIRALEGVGLKRNGQQHFLDKGRTRIGRSDLQTIIVQHAEQANKKMGEHESPIKIRANVVESGVHENPNVEDQGRKQQRFGDHNQHLHSSVIAHFKEEEKQVVSYKHLKPKDNTQRFEGQKTGEDTESHLTKQYRIQNPLYEGLKTGYFATDQRARIEERPVRGPSFRTSKSIKFGGRRGESKNDDDYGTMEGIEARN